MTAPRSPRWEQLRGTACVSVASLLLCAIAAFQICRVVYCDQTPWKGGGFGMFASPDTPGTRIVKVYLLEPDGEVPARLPRLRELGRLRTAPTEGQLACAADRLSGLRWGRTDVPSPGPRPAPVARARDEGAPLKEGERALEPRALRVELWRAAFDLETNEVRARKALETTRLLLAPR